MGSDVFLWDFPVCVTVCVSVSISVFCVFFSSSFSPGILLPFSYPHLFVFIIIIFYYFLDSCLFSNEKERKKGYGFGRMGSWEGSGRS